MLSCPRIYQPLPWDDKVHSLTLPPSIFQPPAVTTAHSKPHFDANDLLSKSILVWAFTVWFFCLLPELSQARCFLASPTQLSKTPPQSLLSTYVINLHCNHLHSSVLKSLPNYAVNFLGIRDCIFSFKKQAQQNDMGQKPGIRKRPDSNCLLLLNVITCYNWRWYT